jgi:hypothetical protein
MTGETTTCKVEFSMIRNNTQQPVFRIDGKQSGDVTLHKVMQEADSEEWLLTNTSMNSGQGSRVYANI